MPQVRRSMIQALICAGLAAFGWSPPARAIPEADYSSVYARVVTPFIRDWSKTEGLRAHDGLPLRYARTEVPGEKLAVIILPGRGDSALKYSELAFDLASRRVSTFVLDLRGQGLSGRETENPEITHVHDFEAYVDDVRRFVDVVRTSRPAGTKLHLMGISLGGTIALSYLRKYPHDFASAVVVSPILRLRTDPSSEEAALFKASAQCFLGNSEKYASDQGPFRSDLSYLENSTIRSAERFRMAQTLMIQQPELRAGGASNRWIREMLLRTRWLRSHPRPLSVPVLTLLTSQDAFAGVREQVQFCVSSPGCQHFAYPQGSHELLMDRDPVRNDALYRAVAWWKQHAGN